MKKEYKAESGKFFVKTKADNTLLKNLLKIATNLVASILIRTVEITSTHCTPSIPITPFTPFIYDDHHYHSFNPLNP